MDSDEEWFETTSPYIVRQRTLLRSPLYPITTNRDDIFIKDEPLTELEYLHNIRKYIWNGKTNRFCGRDGLEWAKVGCYYFSFFFTLGCLFSALIIVYILLLDKKTPRRYLNDSALALDGGINPGKNNFHITHSLNVREIK
jgi:hypothetical protein